MNVIMCLFSLNLSQDYVVLMINTYVDNVNWFNVS